jgi:hypothetical protein
LCGGAGQVGDERVAAQLGGGILPVVVEQVLFDALQGVGEDRAVDGVEGAVEPPGVLEGLGEVQLAAFDLLAEPAVFAVGVMGLAPVVEVALKPAEPRGAGLADQVRFVAGHGVGELVGFGAGAGERGHLGGADVTGQPRSRGVGEVA